MERQQQQDSPRSLAVEERLDALEQLAGKLIVLAREHPVGRALLRKLGLS